VDLAFYPIDEATAREILTWRWPPPYDVYNPCDGEIEEDLAELLKPEYDYHAVYDASGRLMGCCCFGEDALVTGGDYSLPDALDVGLALRPELVGQRLGAPFVEAILRFAQVRAHPAYLRVTIAEFNRASQRLFEQAGFTVTQRFTSPEEDGCPYVVMVYTCAESPAV
jgi:RimJ/RimL family protein N-acetyltransferase